MYRKTISCTPPNSSRVTIFYAVPNNSTKVIFSTQAYNSTNTISTTQSSDSTNFISLSPHHTSTEVVSCIQLNNSTNATSSSQVHNGAISFIELYYLTKTIFSSQLNNHRKVSIPSSYPHNLIMAISSTWLNHSTKVISSIHDNNST
ncbi:unnamed protein product, partial [Vitis vinifera]|uniref:Uncharacterized protein n=1 Tax=Vitis vinifera TaxID=29760 RepID=D7SYU1_VITVI